MTREIAGGSGDCGGSGDAGWTARPHVNGGLTKGFGYRKERVWRKGSPPDLKEGMCDLLGPLCL